MQRYRMVFALLGGLLLAGLLLPRTHAQQTSAAVVTPEVGRPGMLFSFQATGMQPNERVSYWLTAPDGETIGEDEQYSFGADNEGRAAWTWRAPGKFPDGTYTMIAQGIRSGEIRVASFVLQSDAPVPGLAPAPEAERSVSPEVGQAGTQFTFTAGGFAPGERVGYWINAPDGEIITKLDEGPMVTSASEDGIARWDWRSDTEALPGSYTMVARGDSNIEQVIPFEVR